MTEKIGKLIVDNDEIQVVHQHSDARDFECGLCGKTNIGNLFTVINKRDGFAISVGSYCVNKFTDVPSWDTYIDKARGILAAVPLNESQFLIKIPFEHDQSWNVRNIPTSKWNHDVKGYVVSYEDFPLLAGVEGIQIHSSLKGAYEAYQSNVVEVEPKVSHLPKATVQIIDGGIHFTSPYDGGLKDLLKGYGGRWNGVSWYFQNLGAIPVKVKESLHELVTEIQTSYPKFNWVVSPDVMLALSNNKMVKPVAKITTQDGSLIFNFPYDAQLVKVLGKDGLGFRWNKDTKSWSSPKLSAMSSTKLRQLSQFTAELETTYSQYEWVIDVSEDDIR